MKRLKALQELASSLGLNLDTIQSFNSDLTAANKIMRLSRSDMFAFGKQASQMAMDMGAAKAGPEELGASINAFAHMGMDKESIVALSGVAAAIHKFSGADVTETFYKLHQEISMSSKDITEWGATTANVTGKLGTDMEKVVGTVQENLGAGLSGILLHTNDMQLRKNILNSFTKMAAVAQSVNMDTLNLGDWITKATHGDPEALKFFAMTGLLDPATVTKLMSDPESAGAAAEAAMKNIPHFMQILQSGVKGPMGLTLADQLEKSMGIKQDDILKIIRNAPKFEASLKAASGAELKFADVSGFLAGELDKTQSGWEGFTNSVKTWLTTHVPQQVLVFLDSFNLQTAVLSWYLGKELLHAFKSIVPAISNFINVGGKAAKTIKEVAVAEEVAGAAASTEIAGGVGIGAGIFAFFEGVTSGIALFAEPEVIAGLAVLTARSGNRRGGIALAIGATIQIAGPEVIGKFTTMLTELGKTFMSLSGIDMLAVGAGIAAIGAGFLVFAASISTAAHSLDGDCSVGAVCRGVVSAG